MSNWETREVNLWIDNDENLYCEVQSMLEDGQNINEIAEYLEEYWDETKPNIDNVWGAFMDAVDFYSIAEEQYNAFYEDGE